MKSQLSRIYKANQCCDLSDIENAQAQVMEIVRQSDWTKALVSRFNSLERRKKVVKA